jgi:hypothetical protein
VTSPQGHPARREPLLWLQLLGLTALPLESAALLLVLAGADPGRFAGLERLFCWGLGAAAPAALFWRLPPDLWSLLLLQVPLRGRREEQRRLSALQMALPPRLLGALGAVLLLPLLWWSDAAAGLAWSVSPLTSSPRLVVLLLAAALLTLMLWQWQQIIQTLWLFSRRPGQIAQILPLSSGDAAERRLNIGLPLLLLDPLVSPPASERPTAADSAADASGGLGATAQASAEPEPAAEGPAADGPAAEGPAAASPAGEPQDQASVEAAVAPEQGAEEGQGADLDQEI